MEARGTDRQRKRTTQKKKEIRWKANVKWSDMEVDEEGGVWTV